MNEHKNIVMKPIAYIQTDFPTKFGIPRQGANISCVKGRIVFEKEFRDTNALRGLEDYSHIWLIWHFSESDCDKWSPTVRPPRLGGNKRMGVFATRSPFRPNPLGLTCVKIDHIDYDCPDAPVITVVGADLMNQTPIFDIKPYLPYADCISDAIGGFGADVLHHELIVNFPSEIMNGLSNETVDELTEILKQDPRPHYIEDPDRIFGFLYADFEVKFKVSDRQLTVLSVLSQDS